ncbi:MAG: hypothetical protein WC730_01020 [Patescibacteria group bacterium]|jgi:hypothetical protein
MFMRLAIPNESCFTQNGNWAHRVRFSNLKDLLRYVFDENGVEYTENATQTAYDRHWYNHIYFLEVARCGSVQLFLPTDSVESVGDPLLVVISAKKGEDAKVAFTEDPFQSHCEDLLKAEGNTPVRISFVFTKKYAEPDVSNIEFDRIGNYERTSEIFEAYYESEA